MSARPSIGAMRARLSLEKPVDAIADAGAIVRTWTLVANIWAHLAVRTATGEFAADSESPAVTWDVSIRWRGDVVAPMRFRAADRVLAIRACFDPDATRRVLVCRCEETTTP